MILLLWPVKLTVKKKENVDETVNEHKKHNMFVNYIVGPQMAVCTFKGFRCVVGLKINRSVSNFIMFLLFTDD